MAPVLFPVGLVVALIAVMVVRHQAHGNSKRCEAKHKPVSPSGSNAATSCESVSPSASLQQARQITPPTVSLTKGGEFEHGEWWGEQDTILKEAWKEWWSQSKSTLPELNHKIMLDPALRKAVKEVRLNPTEDTEAQLHSLFQPILPKQVYKIPFFTTDGVRNLRQHLDAASYYYHDNNTTTATTTATTAAGIPTRRPNGMNRYGIILDPKIEGAVSYEGINTYVQQLVNHYVRPLCRMLFPEITSRYNPEDDEEHYAFTIRYRADLDMELAEHSDASVYTININLNTPPPTAEQSIGTNRSSSSSSSSADYSGSSLYFVDELTETHQHVSFTPGMAVLHRGQTRHAALPITEGERHNLVIWLFGRHAYVRIAEYDKLERLTPKERWGTTKAALSIDID